MVRHSAEVFAKAGFAPIVVAIPAGADEIAAVALAGIEGVRIVHGGPTRQASVRLALEALAPDCPNSVLIHDAARPGLTVAMIERMVMALTVQRGAIPVLPVIDSLIEAEGATMGRTVERERLRRVQTPQAFSFPAILAAHREWLGPSDAGDDAQVARAAGLTVGLVDGDEALHKLTVIEDFAEHRPTIRVGTGYDVHRLVEGEDLWLGGIKIDHSHGLAGHSDADVAIHALVDAILGALAAGDIGTHFPPSDAQWRGASSDRFLSHAVSLAREAAYAIGNVDLTIVCEAPKIGPYRGAIRTRLAQLLETTEAAVSVKATTTERLGFTGRAEGIAAHAIATLIRQ